MVNPCIDGSNEKVPLQSHVPPNTTDPVRCIVGTQYEHIRCKMFHSKDRGYLLPYEDLDPKSVSEAYQNLIRLWREIVGKCYNISIGGGGVTYQGFKVWMDAFAAPGFSMYITDDSTPFCLKIPLSAHKITRSTQLAR